jgi:hypothetical protein
MLNSGMHLDRFDFLRSIYGSLFGTGTITIDLNETRERRSERLLHH